MASESSETPQAQRPLIVVAILLVIAFLEAFVWISGARGWD
jgi:hypothetical protein